MDNIEPAKNHKEIQHFNPTTGLLEKAQIVKIKNFIQRDCFRQIERTLWYACLPIPEYNTNCYLLKPKTGEAKNEFNCNCQGYVKKGYCSHSDALKLMKDTNGQAEFAF